MLRPSLCRPLLPSITALSAIAAVSGGVALGSSDTVAAPPVRTLSAQPTDNIAAQPTDNIAAQPPADIAAQPAEGDPRPRAAQHRLELAAKARVEKLRLAQIARLRAVEQARVSRSRERVSIARVDPRSAAHAMLADFGWDSSQFGCLDSLWTKESGWSYRASNASSGAYGIPQALPGTKMSSAGADWRTNPITQIRWGLGYIRSTYGSPCSAWSQSRSNGWY